MVGSVSPTTEPAPLVIATDACHVITSVFFFHPSSTIWSCLDTFALGPFIKRSISCLLSRPLPMPELIAFKAYVYMSRRASQLFRICFSFDNCITVWRWTPSGIGIKIREIVLFKCFIFAVTLRIKQLPNMIILELLTSIVRRSLDVQYTARHDHVHHIVNKSLLSKLMCSRKNSDEVFLRIANAALVLWKIGQILALTTLAEVLLVYVVSDFTSVVVDFLWYVWMSPTVRCFNHGVHGLFQ